MLCTRLVIAACMLSPLSLAMATGTAAACEEFVAIPESEAKEARDKLLQSDADPMDRLFAFQKLVCSNQPVLRNYAVREGLKSTTEPLVREQIMLDALLQKTRLDITLVPGSGASKKEKDYAKDRSNLLSFEVRTASAEHGCLSLYAANGCQMIYSAVIKGDKLELNYTPLVGEFRLSDTNELVGFVIPRPGHFGRIPAIIQLF